MPRATRLPTLAELPKGARRDFVEELFEYYRPARRPSLREISERIAANDELEGTASKETVRRMLRGTSVPTDWKNVNAVFLVLCEMAGLNPDEPRWDEVGYSNNGPEPTRAERMADLWNRALDADDDDGSPF